MLKFTIGKTFVSKIWIRAWKKAKIQITVILFKEAWDGSWQILTTVKTPEGSSETPMGTPDKDEHDAIVRTNGYIEHVTSGFVPHLGLPDLVDDVTVSGGMEEMKAVAKKKAWLFEHTLN